MNFAKTLSRNEMKNITGGGCEWSGCGTASSTMNCWLSECNHTYSGADAMECAHQVNSSHRHAIAMCGTNYQ